MELYEVKGKELTVSSVESLVSCMSEFTTGKNTKTGKAEARCENIIVLDTETTSCWVDDFLRIYTYEKGKTGDFYNNLKALAVLYEWTLTIDKRVFLGRDLEDLGEVFDNFPPQVSFLIWVHNLSFEFSFLCNLTTWKGYKAKTSRDILEAVGERWKNITFRCSCALSGLSLDDWGKVLGIKKLKGDLDYNKLRTPKTPLTKKEIGYCVRDCQVVYKGIKGYKKQYKSLFKIPLTATGCVRREVRKRLREDPKWQWNVKNLIPKSPADYKRQRDAYWGAYNAASRIFRGEVIEGIIEHYDYCSAYASFMISKRYPLTPWAYRPEYSKKYKKGEFPDLDLKEYGYIMKATFKKLRPRGYMLYIPSTRCYGEKIERDNGRVLKAEELTVSLTGEDLKTAAAVYEWEELELNEVYSSHKKYLPRPFLEYVLELFDKKSKFKGIKEKREEYHKNKTQLCSLYGMTVSALVRGGLYYDQELDEWKAAELTEAEVSDKLKELKAETPWKMSYFLPYCVGVWVSAYAREALLSCVLEYDDRALYCDTDSLYLMGRADFSWYNKKIKKEIEESCKINGLNYEKARGLDINGKEHHLGYFEKQGEATEFLTLGCKKYIERTTEGELVITLSGVKKEAVSCLGDDIENFKDGFIFDKDAPGMEKLMPTYCYNKEPVIFPDGYVYRGCYGVNLRPVGYVLRDCPDQFAEFEEFLDILEKGVPSQFLYSIRGDFKNEK